MDAQSRYREIKQVTLVGAAVNLLLAVLKIVVGFIGHSHALVADGLHSLSDLLTDLLVVVAGYYGSQDADREHPYGHRRIETAATLILALFLAFVGAGIIYEAAEYFWYENADQISANVLWVVALSIVANEVLFRYTRYKAQQVQSELLHANAWHHRSDAWSSIVVLVGVSGSLLGIANLDAIAAIIVGALIIHMGWRLSWRSIRELIDTGVDNETHQAIHKIIAATPGVLSMHQLRTRSMGGKILVDVHVLVASRISVSEGHYIAQQVHRRLAESDLGVVDVTAHIDPEEDEPAALNLDLPPREQLLTQLREAWRDLPLVGSIDTIQLHYLAGRVEATLVLTTDAKVDDWQDLEKQYQTAVAELATVTVLFALRYSTSQKF